MFPSFQAASPQKRQRPSALQSHLARIQFDNGLLVHDGRVSPDDALKTAAAVLRHHLDVFVDYSEEVLEFEESEKKVDEERDRLRRILNMSVNEIELSVRAANCLNNANITTVGELAMKTEADMLKYRNFGKKSLNEIKDKLTELGLYLGYKFDPELLEGNK